MSLYAIISWCHYMSLYAAERSPLQEVSGKDGEVSGMLYVIICHYMPFYVQISHYMSLCHYMSLYVIICFVSLYMHNIVTYGGDSYHIIVTYGGASYHNIVAYSVLTIYVIICLYSLGQTVVKLWFDLMREGDYMSLFWPYNYVIILSLYSDIWWRQLP
jgi:hypothetical protein